MNVWGERIGPRELRQLLRLDFETGKLYWLPRYPEWFSDGGHSAAHTAAKWNSKNAGNEAFTSADHRGYLHGEVFNRRLKAHRVVFAIVTGRWPNGDIDHIDGDTANNRPANLREATRAENLRNVGSKGGSSRFCGVSWRRDTQKWAAYCKDASGRRRSLGSFAEEAEAARAYDVAARAMHGAFARLNFPETGA